MRWSKSPQPGDFIHLQGYEGFGMNVALARISVNKKDPGILQAHGLVNYDDWPYTEFTIGLNRRDKSPRRGVKGKLKWRFSIRWHTVSEGNRVWWAVYKPNQES